MRCIFWWEWVDCNSHPSYKYVGRAPFTSLRYVPNQTNFVCIAEYHRHIQAKIKNAPQGCIFYSGGSGWIRTTSVVRQQIYSLPRLSNSGARPILVRAAGIEPAFQAWKACILALELCSQQIQSPCIISYFFMNASIY